MSNIIIYGLVDPETNQLRYVGKTTRGLERIIEHTCPSNLKKSNHKNNWLRGLLDKNIKPISIIIDQASTEKEINQLEKFYIDLFFRVGIKLTNDTDGGDGASGHKHTQETKDYLRSLVLGKPSLRAIKVVCEQTNEIFNSMKDAGEVLGMSNKCISSFFKGKKRHCKGYTFRYLTAQEVYTGIIEGEKKPFVRSKNGLRVKFTEETALEEAKKYKSKVQMKEANPSLHDYLNNHNLMKKTGIENLKSKSPEKRKLSVEKVKEIKKLRNEGYSHNQLAQKFDVTRPIIRFILNGTLYKDVK